MRHWDMGHFGCDGVYRYSQPSKEFVDFVMDGVQGVDAASLSFQVVGRAGPAIIWYGDDPAQSQAEQTLRMRQASCKHNMIKGLADTTPRCVHCGIARAEAESMGWVAT